MPTALEHPAVLRVLDTAARKGVTLDVTVFPDSTHTADEAARAVGAEITQIVKSLVFVSAREDGELEPIVCLVSGADRVDLERLAAVIGRRDIRRATAREADELTGFTIGGIPPFGHTQRTRVIMDPELGRYAIVWAAAGLPDGRVPGRARDAAHALGRPRRTDRRAAAGRASVLTAEPRDATVAYPGGLRARWRWGGSGQSAAVFALSEVGGSLLDLGPEVSADPEALCRAELRVDGPAGAWTLRLASTINDEPTAQHWDTAGQLVVKYGFHAYGLDARTGALRWSHRSATPLLAVFASSRLRHVLLQAELETFAIEADGTVAWRIAHSDVVVEAAHGRRAAGADRLRRRRERARSGDGAHRGLRRLARRVARRCHGMWIGRGQPDVVARISWTAGIDPAAWPWP